MGVQGFRFEGSRTRFRGLTLGFQVWGHLGVSEAWLLQVHAWNLWLDKEFKRMLCDV